jgi:hypothetical protein
VAVGHAKDVIGMLDEFGGELAAALPGDVNAQFRDRLHGEGAGRLAGAGADARGDDLNVPPSAREMPEDAFSHGAAANISGADKKDGFHDSVNKLKFGRAAEIVNREITARGAAARPKFP